MNHSIILFTLISSFYLNTNGSTGSLDESTYSYDFFFYTENSRRKFKRKEQYYLIQNNPDWKKEKQRQIAIKAFREALLTTLKKNNLK